MGASSVVLRRKLAFGLGSIGGLYTLSALSPAFGEAPPAPATIGTFPDGVGADSVFVGITVPITGAYSADGQDLQRGYELALGLINAGDPLVAKWGLAGKGVMGKQLRYRMTDSELKPNVAVQAQTQFIQRDRAIMVTGSVSSAEAIAVQELANRERVLNMVGVSGSNDTTGKNCQRYGFRSQQQSYMAAKAIAPALAKALGEGKKAAYLVPDYTYGHSVFDSTTLFMKEHGWTVRVEAGRAAGRQRLLICPPQHRQLRCRGVRQRGLRVGRGDEHEAGGPVRRIAADEDVRAQPIGVPGARVRAEADGGRSRHFRVALETAGPLPAERRLRGRVPGKVQPVSEMGRPRRLHAAAAMGCGRGAREVVQSCRRSSRCSRPARPSPSPARSARSGIGRKIISSSAPYRSSPGARRRR